MMTPCNTDFLTKNNKMKEETKNDKNDVGRPKVIFDLDVVEKLSGLGCTNENIAEWFSCTVRTVERRKSENPEFCRAINEGRSKLVARLRKAQLDACWNGSVPMLIWMGKQLLDQKDKVHNESEIELKDVTPTINLIAKKPDAKQA